MPQNDRIRWLSGYLAVSHPSVMMISPPDGLLSNPNHSEQYLSMQSQDKASRCADPHFAELREMLTDFPTARCRRDITHSCASMELSVESPSTLDIP